MQLAYFLGHKKEQGDGERKWLQRDLVRRLSSSARSQLVCMQASWQSCKNPRPWRLRQIPTVYPLPYPLPIEIVVKEQEKKDAQEHLVRLVSRRRASPL
ncbi:hypothetical protein ALC56_04569 [Trachymyrmex septentrionalis]|uniref:Uncharacterized protein n=1 Tax=Trachymyrmex septentrionalis TaxID=34720 RepID=A0A195FKV1_9HYME|nr:hypothetical protein ALC56_04569 [Trachymyrmex septentrionalis]